MDNQARNHFEFPKDVNSYFANASYKAKYFSYATWLSQIQ